MLTNRWQPGDATMSCGVNGATDITIVTLLAAPEGIELARQRNRGGRRPCDAAVDERLNEPRVILASVMPGTGLFGIVSP